jgi:hypothetical protein
MHVMDIVSGHRTIKQRQRERSGATVAAFV